jgi:hypothetical protein
MKHRQTMVCGNRNAAFRGRRMQVPAAHAGDIAVPVSLRLQVTEKFQAIRKAVTGCNAGHRHRRVAVRRARSDVERFV